MTVDVLRLPGDYYVHAATNGSIVLDVLNNGTTSTVAGTVLINGNLDVKGATTYFESVNANIKDNTITLNAGEPSALFNGGISAVGGTSGLKISRGRVGLDNDNLAAFFEWNENARWTGTGRIGQEVGLFELRVGKTTDNPKFSAIKINAIRIDPFSASTIGAGSSNPRLNIFGQENPTAVMSVAGTSAYESRVIDDDDIPNKKYVDTRVSTYAGGTTQLIYNSTYLKLIDNFVDPAPNSAIIGVVHGNPSDSSSNVTTGTVVMEVSDVAAKFVGIQLLKNKIIPSIVNQNLILQSNGANSQIILAGPTLISTSVPPVPSASQVGFYANPPGTGGTGLFFVSSSTTGVVTTDEVVSRRKALVYGLIF